MQALFSVCCVLAVASASLVVYPPTNYVHQYNDGDFLNHHRSLYTGHYDHANHVVGPAGVPHDTPDVAAAKAVHLAAHAEAKARLAYGVGAHQNELIDTPEVQIAKYQHQAAHVEAKQRLVNPALAYAAVPVETPEVQVAKHEHLAAHAEATLRNAYPALAHAHSAAAGPVDTPEVQQAKVEHFHAHAQAQAQQAYGYAHQHQHQHAEYLDSPVYSHHYTAPAHYAHQAW